MVAETREQLAKLAEKLAPSDLRSEREKEEAARREATSKTSNAGDSIKTFTGASVQALRRELADLRRGGAAREELVRVATAIQKAGAELTKEEEALFDQVKALMAERGEDAQIDVDRLSINDE